eukprot:TRINITY_DN7227_c0_g1_i1.p1 TRINITY_DN7227_c0_g1~~TRINITY_DN7227_c0_g1_i1.p1  ORF type:complete len:4130 (+),score=744.89 TRINITY_DN7227_c0_g1_i1:147-12536(+)
MEQEDFDYDNEVSRVNRKRPPGQHVEFKIPTGQPFTFKKKAFSTPTNLFSPSPEMLGSADTQLPGTLATRPLNAKLRAIAPLERSSIQSPDVSSILQSQRVPDFSPPATIDDATVTPLPPSRPQSQEDALREWQMINDERNASYQKAMVAAFNTISRQRLMSPTGRNSQSVLSSISGSTSPERAVLDDPLLKENPVAYFAKNKDGPVKFVYLNQAKFASDGSYTPYHLKVVPFSEVDREYYTMSSNGVTFVGADGHSEFIPMSRWVREADLFNLISRLDVFRQYKLWKSFRIWRKYVRKRRYKHNRNLLSHCMFTNLPLFRPCLVKIVGECEGMLNTQIIRVKLHASCSVSDFLDHQSQQRRQLKDTVGVFVEKVVHLIEDLCKAVCNPERTKLPDDDPAQQRIKVSLRQILLMEKQKALERAKIAEKVNSEIKQIGNFVRLIDYVLLEYVIRIVLNDFANFLSVMQTDKATIFRTDVIFNAEDEVDFNPNLKQLRSVIGDTLTDAVSVANGLPRVLFHPPFRKFLKLSNMDPRNLASNGPSIRTFLSELSQFNAIQAEIYDIIDNSYRAAAKYARIFNDHKTVYQFGRTWDVSIYRKEPIDLSAFSSDLAKFQKWMNDLEKMNTASSRSILYIDSKGLKSNLIPIPTRAMDDVKGLLLGMATERTNRLLEEFRTYMKQLAADPSSLGEFCEYMDLLKKMPNILKNCTQEAQLIDDMFNLLEDYQTIIASHDIERHSLIHSSLGRFKEAFAQAQSRTSKLVPTYIRMLEKNISSVNSSVETIITTVESGAFAHPDSHPGTLLDELSVTKTQLIDLSAKSEKYAEYQAILDLPVDATRNVLQASEIVEKVFNLWSCVDEWQRATQMWDSTPFMQLKRNEIEMIVNQVSQRISSILADKPGNPVAQGIYTEVERYKSILPYILDLANPAMRPRHWKRLFAAVNEPYNQDETVFTLTTLLQNGILDQKLLITEVSAIASGEHSLELALDAMKQVWAKKALTVMQMRNKKDVYIIAPVKDILDIIEDHQISLSNMLDSQYISGIQEDVHDLRDKLTIVEDVLEQWTIFQQYWLDLEGIFSQDEAPRQLATQTNKFRIVDRRYKALMRNTRKEPNVIASTTAQGVLQMFVESNGMLEGVMSSLKEFLDIKRQAFSRLYFLSDSEVLALLSGPSSPSAQACVRKCFDNVWKLEFLNGPGIPEIVALISSEQEKLTLATPIRTEGTVEAWLVNMADGMKATIHTVMTKAVADHLHTPVLDWASNYPAQVVLAVHMIAWTSDIQLALDSFDPLALKKYHKVLQGQLAVLIDAQKSPAPGTSRQQKQLYSSLILHHIHGLRVVQELADQSINSVYHFAWTRHMRYYWDTDSGHCLVRQGSNTYPYGYEYLGNTSRLVTTPMTERAQISISLAMKSAFGCMLFGPDGIGKTETIRDLARHLARFCFFFNCSAGLSLELSLAYFKGATQSGAFICLEDFNKLNVQVLSVVSQHLSNILAALGQKVDHVSLSGATVPLNRQVGFFATLVGNFAGSQLPENLKTHFRPVSMYDYDREMICEVYLKAEGFSNPSDLSRRLNLTYMLLSDQLSPQTYHCFGLRILKSTLMLATALRRMERQGLDDVAIVARAVRDVNMTRLRKEELPVFTEVMASTFPGVIIPDVDYSLLMTIINKQLLQSGIPTVPSLPNQILQLYEMMIINRGVVIIGEPACGKSVCLNILASSLTQLSKSGLGDQYPMSQEVKVDLVYPGSLEDRDLVGWYNTNSEQWEKGILSKCFQNMSNREGSRSWLVFDGQVDTWADILLTLLDETKTLHLPNGERLRLPTNANIIMETTDVSKASPALLSRMGVLHVSSGQFHWNPFIQAWLSQFVSTISDAAYTAVTLFVREKLDGILLSVKKLLAPEVAYNPQALVNSFCMLLKSHLVSDEITRVSIKEEQLRKSIGATIFSVVWSIGAVVDLANRPAFSQYLKHHLADHGPFPEDSQKNSTMYDYYFSLSTGHWRSWKDACVDKCYPKMLLEGGFIKTPYTAPYMYVLERLFKESRGELPNVMLVGEVGTSKTTILQEFMTTLGNIHPPKDAKSPGSSEVRIPPSAISYRCNGNTNARDFLHHMQTLMPRPRKNVVGSKCTIVFVDDINIDTSSDNTLSNSFSFNSHLELVRQLISTSGFYDKKSYTWQKVENLRFVAANSRGLCESNRMSPRLLRLFYTIYMPTPTKQQLLDYYVTAIKADLSHQKDPDLSDLVAQLVEITVDFYFKLRGSVIPLCDRQAGPLYLWKPKDLSHAFQSLAEFTPTSPSEAVSIFKRLWCHETVRVFVDRLAHKNQQEQALSILQKLFDNKFEIDDEDSYDRVDISSLYQDSIFGHIRGREALNYSPYTIETLASFFSGVWSTVFGKFGDESDSRMSFFPDFLRHMMRLLRILRTPATGRKAFGKHAVLISPEGCGRNSICRLAGFLLGYEVFYASPDVEMDEANLDEHIKKTLKEALINSGVKAKPTIFFAKDWVCSNSSSWKALFDILGGGIGLSVFSPDELEVIRQSFDKLYKSDKAVTLADAISKFSGIVRENLHLVLCLNPAHQGFLSSLQSFPSVLDAAIDYYYPWDPSSLARSAHTILEKWDYDESSKDRVASCLAQITSSVHEFADLYDVDSCKYPVLPSSRHFALTQLFVDMHTNTRSRINQHSDEYQSALSIFAEMSKFADSKKGDIEDSKPLLDQTETDASNLLSTIMRDKKIAEDVRAAIETEEKNVSTEENELEQEKEKAEQFVRGLIRPIERAAVHLGSIPEKDINDMVAAGPTISLDVQGVLACVSVMFGKEPTYNTGVDLLLAPGFIHSIVNFKYHELPPERVKLLKITMDASNLDPETKIDYKASKLPQYLADYVFAVHSYLSHQNEIKASELKVRERTAVLDHSRQTLATKRRALEDVESTIVRLQQQYDACQSKGDTIIKQMHMDDAQIQKARKIITNLETDQHRWVERQNEIEESKGFLLGSCLLAAATLTYLSPFPDHARRVIINKWTTFCDENLIPVETSYTLTAALSMQQPLMKEWENMGLLDRFSMDNALLVMNNPLYPLILDPLGQAAQWIKNMHSKSASGMFASLDVSHPDFGSQFETAINLGTQVLITLPKSKLPHPLVIGYLRQLVYGRTESEGKRVLTAPDGRLISVNESFRLFMTTQSEQSFPPELYLVCNVINFQMTSDCMEATFLKQISQLELSETEKRKDSIHDKILQDKFELKRAEDRLVNLINTQKLNILLDDRALEQIDVIKGSISNLMSRIESATFAAQEMKDESRNICQSLAIRTTQIFRATQYLTKLHSFYRIGISQFAFIVSSAIEKASPSTSAIYSSNIEAQNRIIYLGKVISFAAYSSIARGLSHSHRLVFAFLLASVLSKDSNALNEREFDILMKPASILPKPKEILPKPVNEEWLSDDIWLTLNVLQQSGSKIFGTICKNVTENVSSWRVFSQHPHPHRIPLPEGLNDKMSEVVHILLVRLFCPGKLGEAMSDYITSTIGSQYLEPISADIERAFMESKPAVPILMLVKQGYDPTLAIQRFAVQKSKSEKMRVISMSVSNIPLVKRTINQAASEGYWLLLQNCHLVADAWIPTLARVVEELQAGVPVHQDFRLWLATESSEDFPVSLIRRSIRVWCEPPNGIRPALSFLFRDLTDQFFSSCKKAKPFKKLVFALGFFHGLLMGRRWFGQSGFQTTYEFTESDLQLSITQLREHLNEHGDIPYATLQFLISEVIYGGRILNRWDRRLLRNLLQEFLTSQLMEEKYTFFGSSSYHPPVDGPVASVRTHIDSFPLVDRMDVLGLSEGVRLSGDRFMAFRYDTFMKAMFDVKVPQALSNHSTVLSQLQKLIGDIAPLVPSPLNLLESEPKIVHGPHKKILSQECERLNAIINTITSSMDSLKYCLENPCMPSTVMKETIDRMMEDRIPQVWGLRNVRFSQSLKAYVSDLKAYVAFFQKWLKSGTPIVFWLSAFSRPESLFIHYLQEYASRNAYSVDQLTYDHLFLPEEPPHPPQTGFYARGLSVRGASWDPSNLLTEATVFSQTRHTQMPVIWFKPMLKNDYKTPSPSYNCPILRVTNRMDPMFEDRNVPEAELTFDGDRMSNFVRTMYLPADQAEKHWIKRGVVLMLRPDSEN